MHATTARAGCASSSARIALTVPSNAFTGRPFASVMVEGSAKNERYSSHGMSAASNGAGTAQSLRADDARRGRCARRARGRGYPAVVPPVRELALADASPPGAGAPPSRPTGVAGAAGSAGAEGAGGVDLLRSGSRVTCEPDFTLK